MSTEAAPTTGEISVEQAVGLLGSAPAPEQVEREEDPAEVVATDTESEAEPTAEEAPEPEEVTEPPEEGAEEPAEPAIPAPQSWDTDAKVVFDTLPRAAQEVVLAREADRDKAVQRSVQEAADARKVAETAKTEAQSVTQIKAVLDQIIPRAVATFESKWADWTPERRAELARTDPTAWAARSEQFNLEQAEMARLGAVNQQTQRVAYAQFVQQESEKLASFVPAFADPKEGPVRKAALGQYLIANNVPAEQIPLLDANTIRLAHKAMLWDEAQTKTAAAAKPKTPPAQAKPPVRPAAAAPAAPRTRTVDAARDRLAKTGSTDDAVGLLRALRTSKG